MADTMYTVRARHGDRVLVHFTTTDMAGNILESSRPGEPKTAIIGNGTINPLFEETLVGLAPGDVRTVTMSADQAYGKYRKQLVFTVKRKTLGLKEEPYPGQILVISLPSGQKTHAIVKEVKATKLVMDANHPFAGKDLLYTLELVDVQTGSSDEQGSTL